MPLIAAHLIAAHPAVHHAATQSFWGPHNTPGGVLVALGFLAFLAFLALRACLRPARRSGSN